jgi:hypothetical protein
VGSGAIAGAPLAFRVASRTLLESRLHDQTTRELQRTDQAGPVNTSYDWIRQAGLYATHFRSVLVAPFSLTLTEVQAMR